MNEVFETVAEVLEELRSEAEEREYSVHTNESENADKALKKANREYETVLAELSAEHREFFENYMDIVDHAHFQEEQRAYYQGMVDVMQIFDGLGILKERNKVKEVLMHIKKIVQTGWMAYREADHPVFLQNNSEIIQKKSKSFCYSVSWVLYVRR